MGWQFHWLLRNYNSTEASIRLSTSSLSTKDGYAVKLYVQVGYLF